MVSGYQNKVATVAVAAAAFALISHGVSAQEAETGHGNRYRYELTLERAMDCALTQNVLRQAKAETDPEYARYHDAIALTWLTMAEDMHGTQLTPEELNAHWGRLTSTVPDGTELIPLLEEMSRPCEIMSNLYSEVFIATANRLAELNPETFADRAAFKNQTAGDYPDPPVKELLFGDWFFFARGNSCLASHAFDDGAVLTFAFTNFFDGRITFEWDGLPHLDQEAEDYEDQLAPHQLGEASDENFAAIFADGITYENYPGTAVFVDNTLISGPNGGGVIDGQKYVFGAYIQRPYYNKLPLGRELSIKVLGQETHRVRIDDRAFWNEMSNCMAQYPFG